MLYPFTLVFLELISVVKRPPAVLPDFKHSDATGPHRMSTYVSPDEVHPSVERNTEAMHLHTHDR